MRHKEFIESIYNERAKDDRNSKTLAHLMRNLSVETLSGDKYINELLQNADDAGKVCVGELAVSFILTKQFLIFKHNGKPFDEQDVIGISDAANPNRIKTEDQDTIGNKGIGFKSVFNMADYVLIISNNYFFRFDENYHKWKGVSRDYPWQIIPIWTDLKEVHSEVSKFVDKSQVIIIFKIRNEKIRAEMKEHLSRLIDNTKILLFFRHIRHINFQDTQTLLPSKQLSIKKIEQKLNGKDEKENTPYKIDAVKITKDNQIIAEWHVYRSECKIPASIKKEIMDVEAIPSKYKKADSVTLSLACQHQAEKILPVSYPKIFCYLPTDVEIDFPFVVNADFLLDSARAQLQNNVNVNHWNSFLFAEIFSKQFEFFSYLAKKITVSHWAFVPNLIAEPSLINKGPLIVHKPLYEKAFKEGLTKFCIVTNLSKKLIIKVENTQIDRYNFIQKFGSIEQEKYCANPGLINVDRLHRLGAKVFDIDQIIETINESNFANFIKNPENNVQFIIYLYELEKVLAEQNRTNELKKIDTMIRSTPLILSTIDTLEKPENVYFPDKSLKYLLQRFELITLVHKVMSSRFKANKEITAWLNHKGLKKLALSNIIEKVNQKQDQLIEFTQAIAKKLSNNEFKDNEVKQLQKLKVITKSSQLISGADGYFSNEYQPLLKLESCLSDYPNFIYTDYLDSKESKEGGSLNPQLKHFFTTIGVRECLDESNLNKILQYANSSESDLLDFTRLLFTNFYLESNEDENSFFSTHLKQALGQLKFLTNRGFRQIETCYISNFYQPEMPLDGIVDQLDYISSDYVDSKQEDDDQEIIIKWREFFKEIGIRDKVSFEVKQHISRNAADFDYLTYLQKMEYEFDPDLQTQLCPPETLAPRFLYQHSISYYFEIDFINQILPTPVFWQVINSNWPQIKVSANYKTIKSNRKVPTNLYYYVNKAVQLAHNARPQDLYAPKINEIFGDEADELKFATVAHTLTDQQIENLGFKTFLDPEDCLLLLSKIASRAYDQNSLIKITYIYQDLCKSLAGKPLLFKNGSSLSTADAKEAKQQPSLLLLNQAGEYVDYKQLYALLSDALPLREVNRRLLKKPESLSLDDFSKISSSLNVSTIENDDLEVKTTSPASSDYFISLITEKLDFIGIIESYKCDIISEGFANYFPRFVAKIQKKLKKLVCKTADTIWIFYKDIIFQEVDSWFSQAQESPQSILYHNPELGLGVTAIRNVCRHLHAFLNLKMDVDTFWEILLSKEEVIIKNYRLWNLTDENITYAKEFLLNPVDEKELLESISVSDSARLPRLGENIGKKSALPKKIKNDSPSKAAKDMTKSSLGLQEDDAEMAADTQSTANSKFISMDEEDSIPEGSEEINSEPNRQDPNTMLQDSSSTNSIHSPQSSPKKRSLEEKYKDEGEAIRSAKRNRILSTSSIKPRGQPSNPEAEIETETEAEAETKVNTPLSIAPKSAKSSSSPIAKSNRLLCTAKDLKKSGEYNSRDTFLSLDESPEGSPVQPSANSVDSDSADSADIAIPSSSPKKPASIITKSPATLFSQKPKVSVLISKEQRVVTGRAGERCIYEDLKKKYLNKHGSKFSETSRGLEIKHKDYTKVVSWCNKGLPDDKDSGKPYDFIVKKFNKDGKLIKTRYIEVKSTLSSGDEIEMNFSLDEWNWMLNKSELPKGYILYSVRNLCNSSIDQWKRDKIKDFKERVDSEEVKVKDYKRAKMTLR